MAVTHSQDSPRLCYDVLSQVLEETQAVLHHAEAVETLTTCARVNKQMRLLAQRPLLRDVRLTTEASVVSFLAFIQQHPHLLKNIESFTLTAKIYDPTAAQKVWGVRLPALLSQCTHLEHLHLGSVPYLFAKSTIQILRLVAPTLRSLTISQALPFDAHGYFMRWNGSFILPHLYHLTRLERLEVRGLAAPSDDPGLADDFFYSSPAKAIPASLRSLKLHKASLPKRTLVDILTACSGNSFAFELSRPRYLQADSLALALQEAPNLQSVEVTTCPSQNPDPTPLIEAVDARALPSSSRVNDVFIPATPIETTLAY